MNEVDCERRRAALGRDDANKLRGTPIYLFKRLPIETSTRRWPFAPVATRPRGRFPRRSLCWNGPFHLRPPMSDASLREWPNRLVSRLGPGRRVASEPSPRPARKPRVQTVANDRASRAAFRASPSLWGWKGHRWVRAPNVASVESQARRRRPAVNSNDERLRVCRRALLRLALLGRILLV